MTQQQKKNLWVFLLVGLVYFSAFILPNWSGAKEPNMLSIFNVDEYAQYPQPIQMLTLGKTFYQTLRNFTVYLHYFYGYPFYFFSALVVLPIRLIYGANWSSMTSLIVMSLRQGINVLPMLVAVFILVYLQTRFKSLWQSLGLFLLLLCVPVVVTNDLWWHPDSLVFLWVVLVFFFLDRDDYHFGRNFFFAAVFCGLAIGTKILGIFFALAIPVYLFLGWRLHKISLRRALLLAPLFVLVMFAAVVVANPLLLLPQERKEIIAVQVRQFHDTTGGFYLSSPQPFIQLGVYTEQFRENYGELVFVLLALAALIYRIWRGPYRLLNIIILAWEIPYTTYFGFIAGTHRVTYLLPMFLPIFSALPAFLPSDFNLRCGWRVLVGQGVVALVCIVQFGLFLKTDIQKGVSQFRREIDSPSIAFYQHLDTGYLERLPQGTKLTIYRDWKIYVPERRDWNVEISWNLMTPAVLTKIHPDLILIEQANVGMFLQPGAEQAALDPGQMKAWITFYGEASSGQLKGYHLLMQDSFGIALIKDELYQQYFITGSAAFWRQIIASGLCPAWLKPL